MAYDRSQRKKIETKLIELAEVLYTDTQLHVHWDGDLIHDGFNLDFDGLDSVLNLARLHKIEKILRRYGSAFFLSTDQKNNKDKLVFDKESILAPSLFFTPINPVFKEVEEALDRAIASVKFDKSLDEKHLKEWQSSQPVPPDYTAPASERPYPAYLKAKPASLSDNAVSKLETQWRDVVVKQKKGSTFKALPGVDGHMDEHEDLVIAYLSRIMNEAHYEQRARVVCTTDEKQVESPEVLFTVYIYNPITSSSLENIMARLMQTFRGSAAIKTLY